MSLSKPISHGPNRTADHLVKFIYRDLPIENHAVITDYGLYSRKQYEAVFHAVRSGDITADDLHGVAGDGPGLTKLLQSAPHNPHKDVVFKTRWDDLFVPEIEDETTGNDDQDS